MHTNLAKPILILLLLCATSQGTLTARSFETALTQSKVVGGGLTVTQISAASTLMEWSPFASPGQRYSVTVTDLTNSTVLTAFRTNNTSAIVAGQISGHTFRYEVTDGVNVSIIELVVGG